MKTMLLKGWSSDREWNPIAGVIIRVDAALAKRLLSLYAEYTTISTREERLREIVLFDYNATYLQEERLPAGVADLIHAHSYEDTFELLVPDLIAAQLSGEDDWDTYSASMEICRVHITRHGVRWSGLVKNTDVEIATAYLDYPLLREVAG